VIAVADYTSEVKEFVAGANRQHPTRPIVLVIPASGNGVVGEAFEAGVDDIVSLPHEELAPLDPSLTRQLVFTIEKAVARKRGGTDHAKSDKRNVICVLGLKGGSGKTLTATNLCVALAQAGRSVALLDLDLQFGDCALAMGLSPERTIYDLVRSGGSVDAEKLEDFLVEHSSGVRALLAPVRPDQAAMITVPFLSEVERLLSEMHEFVVIDTPPSFAPEVISAVDSSTDVLVIAMRDTLSLKNTRLGLETLERMDYDRRRMKILLNRANTNVGIEREDVLAILGRRMSTSLQQSSEAGKAFTSLAQLYTERDQGLETEQQAAPRPAPARRRLFTRAARS
jgi:pilus assembly protein CpaE